MDTQTPPAAQLALAPCSAGSIWPTTPEYSLLWWLAAEIVEQGNDMSVPDGVDPRVWCAMLWPDLHEHWMERISEYAKRGSLQNDLPNNGYGPTAPRATEHK